MSTYLTKRLNKKHFLSLAKFDTTFNKLTIYRKIRKFKNLSWFNSKKTQLSSKLTVFIWKPKRVIICKKLLKNLGIDIDLRYYLYYYCYSFTICLFLFFSFFFFRILFSSSGMLIYGWMEFRFNKCEVSPFTPKILSFMEPVTLCYCF